MLNTMQKFAATAAAPILLNIVLISALILNLNVFTIRVYLGWRFVRRVSAVHLDRGGLRERQTTVSDVVAEINASVKRFTLMAPGLVVWCRANQSRYRCDFGVDTARRVRVVFVFRGSRKPTAAGCHRVAVGRIAVDDAPTRRRRRSAPLKVRTARLNLRSF